VRRIAWVSVGVAVGLGLAFAAYRRVAKAKRAALEAVSPEGLARGFDRAWTSVNAFADEVQEAAHQREAELRRTLLATD
jgi:hypothetical protein